MTNNDEYICVAHKPDKKIIFGYQDEGICDAKNAQKKTNLIHISVKTMSFRFVKFYFTTHWQLSSTHFLYHRKIKSTARCSNLDLDKRLKIQCEGRGRKTTKTGS